MRQQQQRSRNRNRGRKSTNPLSRNFESNGPDVKIRGNASHIAEKYSVLARDAQTSGDTVMAENYFQHAEHYFRIVATAQQNNPQANANNNSNGSNRQTGDNTKQATRNNSSDKNGDGPQPELDDIPAEVALKNDATGNDPEGEEKGDSSNRNRRNGRRPSNTRRTARNASPKNDDSDTGNSDTGNASNEADGLSKDAASLPSGLIGTVGDESSAPVTTED